MKSLFHREWSWLFSVWLLTAQCSWPSKKPPPRKSGKKEPPPAGGGPFCMVLAVSKPNDFDSWFGGVSVDMRQPPNTRKCDWIGLHYISGLHNLFMCGPVGMLDFKPPQRITVREQRRCKNCDMDHGPPHLKQEGSFCYSWCLCLSTYGLWLTYDFIRSWWD